MTPPKPAFDPNELPPPSADLVLIREMFGAIVASLPRKERERVVATFRQRMNELSGSDVVTVMRPPKHRAGIMRARREAFAWMRVTYGLKE